MEEETLTTNPTSLVETTNPRDFDTEAINCSTQRGSTTGEEDDAGADIVFVVMNVSC